MRSYDSQIILFVLAKDSSLDFKLFSERRMNPITVVNLANFDTRVFVFRSLDAMAGLNSSSSETDLDRPNIEEYLTTETISEAPKKLQLYSFPLNYVFLLFV